VTGERGTAMALIGAQWGSEGKGVIAHLLAGHFDGAVRVGGPNAGHSFYEDGRLYVARSVPCVWTNPDVELFIGAGAAINPDLLMAELEETDTDITVDPVAVIITEEMEHRELGSIRAKIGSTAEGVGEARVARMRRNGDAMLARDYTGWSDRVRIGSVSKDVAKIIEFGGLVFLEGTQGSGLSLLHGTRYPFATSTDTNSSGLASEVGIAPSDVGHVQLVARTFPIRVAGNSGPMGEELDWSYFVERGLAPAPEKTTVTKKVRRISEWYWPVVDDAVRLNRPCGLWLTFGDYLDPEVLGTTDISDSPAICQFIDELTDRYDFPVLGVGTGPVKDADGEIIDWATARVSSKCAHGVAW
jgi:adenylosuccinate synthase